MKDIWAARMAEMEVRCACAARALARSPRALAAPLLAEVLTLFLAAFLPTRRTPALPSPPFSVRVQAKKKSNVFSEDYAGPNVKVGMAGYGKAPKGSESAARAKKGKKWVKTQVKQLCQIIADMGTAHPKNGRIRVQFGPLFIAYQDISDTLVGMLQRSKKWGLIKYKGEMLWQGRDNDVWIVLTEKWVTKYGS